MLIEKKFKNEKNLDQKNVANKSYQKLDFKEYKPKKTYFPSIKPTQQTQISNNSFNKPIKNNRINSTLIEHAPSKKHVNQIMASYPRLGNDSPHRAKRVGITKVTACSDMHESVFALKFFIECLTRKKQIFYPRKAKVGMKLNKKEKIPEIKKGFYKSSNIK